MLFLKVSDGNIFCPSLTNSLSMSTICNRFSSLSRYFSLVSVNSPVFGQYLCHRGLSEFRIQQCSKKSKTSTFLIQTSAKYDRSTCKYQTETVSAPSRQASYFQDWCIDQAHAIFFSGGNLCTFKRNWPSNHYLGPHIWAMHCSASSDRLYSCWRSLR